MSYQRTADRSIGRKYDSLNPGDITMMRRMVVIIGAAWFLTACTMQPVHSISDEFVSSSYSGRQLDVSDVETAILRGAKNKRWSARVLRPGLIEAAIAVRSHRAIVEIPYTAEHYSIKYKHSENLDYKDGEIHRNYNKWVLNLSASIQRQLSVL